MGLIIGNNCAATHFATRAGGGRYGDKMGNFIGDVNVSSDKIVILEQVFPVVYPESDGPRNIQGSAATDPDDAITRGVVIGVSAVVDVRFNRVLVYGRKYGDGNPFPLQVADDLFKET